MGVTSIDFWPYVITTWVARLPGALVMVYFGHVGRISLESAARDRVILEPLHFAILAIGLAASIAATIYITITARRAIDEYVKDIE